MKEYEVYISKFLFIKISW